MRFDATTRTFSLSAAAIEELAIHLQQAIRYVRLANQLPLEGGPRPMPLSPACLAEVAILDGARNAGIDLGATRPGELDVRER